MQFPEKFLIQLLLTKGESMKICLTSTGQDLESEVDPRFGRCGYFIFYDTETEKFEALANTNAVGMSGVGIQNAQLMAEKEIKTVLTGNMGPNSANVLQQAGIGVITGITGKVKNAIEQFKSGQIQQETPQATVSSHSGMGGASGIGKGMGMGMGQQPQYPPQPPQMSKEQEIQSLKQQAGILKEQVDAITKRVKELDKNK